ncbi:axonemal dynein light intermediate polypeptide 1 [Brachionichthys hirsutus]|uniref:axonemal dynein light intermediate polypeptide 1 n=1 Tax=Brachionichthys hirsutus TaxID=412623 RepID=UPI0036051E54
MSSPRKSLLKYKSPIRISKTSGSKPTRSSGLSNKKSSGSLEILDSILPPREWEEENLQWEQHVSSTPSTRSDVISLEKELRTSLKKRDARETGVCPIRRELYSQCFDELIRQVAMNCAERGLLLVEIRNEIQMTIDTYETVLHSSFAFGIRKSMRALQSKEDVEARISKMQNERNVLITEINEQKARCDAIEKRENEKAQIEEKKHIREIQFMEKANQQLKVTSLTTHHS